VTDSGVCALPPRRGKYGCYPSYLTYAGAERVDMRLSPPPHLAPASTRRRAYLALHSAANVNVATQRAASLQRSAHTLRAVGISAEGQRGGLSARMGGEGNLRNTLPTGLPCTCWRLAAGVAG